MKILIVDDEREMVEMMMMRLRASRYEVMAAYDGEEGLQRARTEKPDLIILDVMLPKIEGDRLCAMLRKEPQFAHTPVILLSAKQETVDEDWHKACGADAYMLKPFEPHDLLEKIKALLKDPPRALKRD
jgi:two-component system, OmpR family, alkaline phosphatase synthesis response regulator PhoP